MVKIKHSELHLLDELFAMNSGYVMDFSDKTFAEFFEDEFGIEIYSLVYAENGSSKANRLRSLLIKSSPLQAITCR